ncbi:lipopolysaccharide biosynthesis protein [Mesorhizobium sp. WSM3626]|uniref:lipopolysaccharide biosynthesis protein n=1 Tax=Mesorhizobium sp. WSM3626 TaxID=1040987 RepID=UPI0004B38B3A|nr:lipopolysaccharide biosynthesis protein [Mesorhizobium sp. WSM3626]
MDGIKGRLAKGAAWITAARLITNLLGLVSTLVLARLLTPGDFGIVALGWTVLAILNSVTEISIGAVLIHHPNPTKEHLDTAWTLSAVRAAAVAAMLMVVAMPAESAFAEPRLPPVLAALAISTLIGGLGSPRRILLTRDLVFWQQFLVEVSQKLVGLIVSAVFAFIFKSYWALVAGTLASDFTGLVISYVVAPFKPKPGLRHWREMFGYSIWLTLAQAINTLNWRFDHLLIGAFLGKTPLGYYSVGDNLAAMPTREAIAPLTSVLFPAFAHVKNRDDGGLEKVYQSSQALVTMIALPVGVGMALIAEPLVRLTMTDKWLPAVIVIQALSAVFAIQTLGSLAQPLAMATGDTRLLFKRDVQAFVLRVPSVVVGLWLGGLAGVAIARAVAGVIGIFFNLQVVRQLTGIGYLAQVRPNLRSLASAGVMIAAVLVSRSALPSGVETSEMILNLASQIAIGAISFAGAQLLQWNLMRRPVGPETELIALGKRLLMGRGARLLGRWA